GEVECLPQPDKSTVDGLRWVYRLDGHRKCWFQAVTGTATVKHPARQGAAKNRVATAAENETSGRKRKAVDARVELLRSVPAETSQATRPAPTPKVVDAGPLLAIGTATFGPSAPVLNGANDQLNIDNAKPRKIDAEGPLAAAPAAGQVVASMPSAMAVIF